MRARRTKLQVMTNGGRGRLPDCKQSWHMTKAWQSTEQSKVFLSELGGKTTDKDKQIEHGNNLATRPYPYPARK